MTRPRISVCMAAYNGERYIEEQLRSILGQLSPEDEVVVVDDASTDGTPDVVRALQDERIRLLEHTANQGIVATFEEAIRSAANDIIFLSDQDDVWAPEKVAIVLRAFLENPDVTLVATDAAVMDANGTLLFESYFRPRGKFRPGLWANLLRNRYGGCTMAFRVSILPEILPFPRNYDVLHDIWIGVRNYLSHGRALYIDQPLIWGRRHAATATGRKKMSLLRKVRIRLHLLRALADFSIRKRIRQTRTKAPECSGKGQSHS